MLGAAVISRDIKTVQYLLERGYLPTEKGCELQIACDQGCLDMLKLLLHNEKNKGNCHPTHTFNLHSFLNKDDVRTMLRWCDHLDQTSLHVALLSKRPHLRLIRYLINEGSDLNAKSQTRNVLGCLWRSRIRGKPRADLLRTMIETKLLSLRDEECVNDFLRGVKPISDPSITDLFSLLVENGAPITPETLPNALHHSSALFQLVLAAPGTAKIGAKKLFIANVTANLKLLVDHLRKE